MWFRHKHLQNIHINGTVSKVKAKEFSNLEHPVCTIKGWLERFKNCSGVVHRTVIGKARNVDLGRNGHMEIPHFLSNDC
jgi:hypothetical protein